MFYGAAVWDPLLIISQIVSLQCLFYLSLGLWQTILLGPTHGSLTVVFVFGWQQLNWSGWDGWLAIGTHLLSAVVAAGLFVWIVERAKKCLDFAVTLYLVHFVMCWAYAGFPYSLAWWLTNGLGLLILSLLSEALCLRREMADIPVTSTSRARGGASAPLLPTSSSAPVAAAPVGTAPTGAKPRPAAAAAAGGASGGGGGGSVQMSERVAGVKVTTRLLSGSES